MQTGIEAVFRRPVIPVLTVASAEEAVSVARALAAGGLDVIELTLRTPAALEAIRAVRESIAGALVGAGTVLSAQDLEAAVDAGAQFLVSPGTRESLAAAASGSPVPWLPGAATVSESLALLDLGYAYQKLFPAVQVGGTDYLDAVRGPLPAVTFCPTGGVSAETAPAYLSRANVAAVGGSWVAPRDASARGDWSRLTDLARAAGRLERAWGRAAGG